LLRDTIKRIDKFTYISETIKNDLTKLGIKDESLIYFPNCVNLKKFDECQVKRENIHKTLNLITVARFAEKKKGFDLIQKIGLKMKENNINFKWKIIGENSKFLLNDQFIRTNPDLFEIINNIENINEEYFPHLDLIKLYKSSDLYINLSRIESFGMTYMESLASNVPIISFVSKGSNEIIIDKFNGFLIKENSITEFVNMIEKLSQQRDIINNMRQNCFDSIKKFDLDLISNKLIDSYKKII